MNQDLENKENYVLISYYFNELLKKKLPVDQRLNEELIIQLFF